MKSIDGTSALDFFNSAVKKNYSAFQEGGKNNVAKNICIIQKEYLDCINSSQPLIISGVKIDFSSDIWDFNSLYIEGKSVSMYVYDFSSDYLSEYQKVILKLYTMYSILEKGIHQGGLITAIFEVKHFLEFLYKNKVFSLQSITLDNIKAYFDSHTCTYSTIIQKKCKVKQFFVFYSMIATNIYTSEFRRYFENTNTTTIKAQVNQNKTPLLPSGFYKTFTEYLYNTVLDTDVDMWERGYCGLLYIDTQTGLRRSEIGLIQSDGLEVTTYNDMKMGILTYYSTKNGGTKSESTVYVTNHTVANEKVITVFNILKELFAEKRNAMGVKFLVPRDITLSSRNAKRETVGSAINIFLMNLCIKHCKEWNLLNTEKKDMFAGEYKHDGKGTHRKNGIYAKSLKNLNLQEGDIVSLPTSRQFRVYVASELRERGISDRITHTIFGHTAADMYGYYARPAPIQEKIDFSKELIADVVENKTAILGPKGQAYMEKIDEIIKENDFNVESDLDAIIKAVCNEMPIRAKSCGFCVKSNPRRECRHDAKTDEFMCAYGACPNHCLVFYNLPEAYKKVKDIAAIVQYNVDAEYIQASQKEAYKLQHFIDHELIPTIEETKKELLTKTWDKIIMAHPTMQEINIEQIESEITEWIKLIKNVTPK